MTTTLFDGTTTIELSDDLYWSDEHAWHPVEQSAERTITGALIVSSALRVGGRPITLEPEDDNSAWLRLSVVAQLRNWAAVPGRTLVLTLRGVTHTVIFRHHDGAGVEATPVVHFSDVDAGDFYKVVLRLMEI